MIIKDQKNKKVYSDGEVTEAMMLDVAQNYPEDKAEDYIAENSSYTINNTFSSVRKNILNWYPFQPEAEILEVGAGMGAITGMLCDKAKHVTAIEMSQARADVIRARYGERNNLEVISENINAWDTEKRFDYIVFIGVLEYAALFSDSRRPYDEFLHSVKHLLKKNGKVLFAIENRFGLKYWLGAAEDHLQQPFIGIKGYSEERTARTFSKSEIEEMLSRVGLKHYRFYSVLPDYKFPELVFSEEYKPDYMNLQKISFTYAKNSLLYANEKKLYKDIINNGTFPFFANSFLIEASADELEQRHILHVSAKGEVYKEYRVSTVIDNFNKVYKIPMHKNAKSHILHIAENTKYLMNRGVSVLPVSLEGDSIRSEMYAGVSAQKLFREALSNDDWDTIRTLLDSLKASLIKSSELLEYNINNILVQNNIALADIDYGPILQKAFIDMTFYNSFWENNDLLFFDQEWCFERVPLKFCLYYTVKSAYIKADVETGVQLQDLLGYLEIGEQEYKTYDALEEIVWSKILYRQTDFYGQEGYCNRYSDDMDLLQQKSIAERRLNEDEIIIKKQIAELEAKGIDLCNKERTIKRHEEELCSKEKELLNTEEKLHGTEEELRNIGEQLYNTEAELHSIRERLNNTEGQLRNTEQEIRNKEGHIEQLLEVEREYEREKRSKCYRIALKLRAISTFFLPQGSKRRFLAKVVVRGLRHPISTLKMVNLRRIKNCITILRTEDAESAMNHYRLVEEYEKSRRTTLEEVEITQVDDTVKPIEEYERLSFKRYNKPQVSIIIPVYNQFDYTYHCLQSILKNSGTCTYEVIIANDCSTDLTSRLDEIVEGVSIINNAHNLRFLRNCNNAATQARAEFILFLNNDTQVQDDWLSPLLEAMDRDKMIGMIGSKLIYPDGSLQEAGGIIWKDASAWNYGNRQNPNDSEFNYVREVDYISGASIMVRRSLWEEIGGFDERFAPAYCEDSDLAFEVRKHGYKVVYQPKSVVVHFEGVSNGTDVGLGQKKYQLENQSKFYTKWQAVLLSENFENGKKLFVARERSSGKRHILVIDHYVPQYDKDAGSKTTFMYLKMLIRQGYKITFLGDNFYQHEPYTTELQQMGVFVLYGPKYAEHWKEWLEENIQFFDVFYLNRPHISVKYIDFIKERSNAKVIYYGHDLHFLRLQREYELNGDAKLLKESKDWMEKELYLMRKADMSYYPSDVEVEEIHKIDSTVPVKAITAYAYETFMDVQYDIANREGLLFVGGFGHGPNLDAVLWFLDKIYPEVYKRTKAPFYIVGSKAPEEITSITTEGVVVKGFVTEEELQKLYCTTRLTVVPLRYGAGVKGKVVEALYYGSPIVTTSVGAEGIRGIEKVVEIQDDEQAIINSICEMYDDGETMKEMSKKCQDFIRKNFAIDVVWNTIKEDFS